LSSTAFKAFGLGGFAFLSLFCSGLVLAESTSASLLLTSNMEIREVVGASEEVSGRPSELVVENSASELLAPTDFTRRIFAGSPRCDLLTAFPFSPPTLPCAIGLGLTLRLAASVAAMKLALLGPVDEAAPRLFPPTTPAGDER
jgi:hypothetical protein